MMGRRGGVGWGAVQGLGGRVGQLGKLWWKLGVCSCRACMGLVCVVREDGSTSEAIVSDCTACAMRGRRRANNGLGLARRSRRITKARTKSGASQGCFQFNVWTRLRYSTTRMFLFIVMSSTILRDRADIYHCSGGRPPGPASARWRREMRLRWALVAM